MAIDKRFENYPNVILLADVNSLAVSVVNLLINIYCQVGIYTDDENGWRNIVAGFSNRELVAVYKNDLSFQDKVADYAVFFSKAFNQDYYVEDNDSARLDKFINLATLTPKHAFVFPDFEQFSTLTKNKFDSANIFITSDILGEGLSLFKNTNLTKILIDVKLGSPVEINLVESFWPADVKLVAENLLKSIFTFDGRNKTLWVSGPQLTGQDVAGILKTVQPEVQLVLKSEPVSKDVNPTVEHVILPTNIEEMFRKTILTGQLPKVPEKRKIATTYSPKVVIPQSVRIPVLTKTAAPKHRKGQFVKRVALRGVLAVLSVLLLLVGLFAANAGFLYKGLTALKTGDTGAAKYDFIAAKRLGKLLEAVWTPASYIPGFSWGRRAAAVLRKGSEVGERTAGVAQELSILGQNITQKEEYDLSVTSRDVSLELDLIYRELGFLEGELDQLQAVASFAPVTKTMCPRQMLNKLGRCADLSSVRETVLFVKELIKSMPGVLGVGQPKNYLVLFQNNMELRPTGGFIGSFGLAKFEKGKLAGFQVLDVYSADGQLRGHVDPPAPIKNYLGEAGWYLRDSNWDPDFAVSAQRAEWFLEKEMDISVDGVVGVDLEVAKKAIAALGPVKLLDFGRTISADNLYEVTQVEAEKDFFPGSRRKADFLTSLSNAIVENVLQSSPPSRAKLVQVALESIRQKHIQLYFNDPTLQESFLRQGLAGELAFEECGAGCISDGLAMAEANVGVNKANYFIKRTADLTVDLKEAAITKTLVVTLKNGANPVLGGKGKYKTYLRVFAPGDVSFRDAKIEVNREIKERVVELEEGSTANSAGVLAEVLPGQEVKITFVWDLHGASLTSFNNYNLLWRKQAGTDADDIKVRFRGPVNIRARGNPPFSLTKDRAVGYNTTLLTDFTAQVAW